MEKLYEFVIEERNGEQEYSHFHLVTADNLDDARSKADHYAMTWYEDPDVEVETDDGFRHFHFFGGCISACVDYVMETDKSRWMKQRFDHALI